MKHLFYALLVSAVPLLAAETSTNRTLPIRGLCIQAPASNRVDEFIKFIEDGLAPRSVNVLILRVDYTFQFRSHPEMADPGGLSREQAQQIAAACQRHQIRVIPLVNLLVPVVATAFMVHIFQGLIGALQRSTK